jgi:hypothetical protein
MLTRQTFRLAALAAATTMLGTTPAGAAPLAADESPQSAPTTPASRATIDPETRSIRAPERGESQPATARSAARTQMPAAAQRMTRQKKWGADGSTGFQLDASTLRFTVVRRAADGGIDSQCVQGEERAMQVLKTQTRGEADHD